MLATEYVEYYGFKPQGKNESDQDFKARIASQLRRMNKPIEAHEAYNDKRYEQSENVMDGVFGMIAQALSGKNYPGNELDNDFVVGKLVRYEMSPEGRRQEEANKMIASMLSAGLSPDDLKKLSG